MYNHFSVPVIHVQHLWWSHRVDGFVSYRTSIWGRGFPLAMSPKKLKPFLSEYFKFPGACFRPPRWLWVVYQLLCNIQSSQLKKLVQYMSKVLFFISVPPVRLPDWWQWRFRHQLVLSESVQYWLSIRKWRVSLISVQFFLPSYFNTFFQFRSSSVISFISIHYQWNNYNV